jgi:hypothetical protein
VTRIKYKKVGSNLISQPILCNTEFLHATIFCDSLTYVIYSDAVDMARGSCESLSSVKRKVKCLLKELGANFNDEIRAIGKTEKFEI